MPRKVAFRPWAGGFAVAALLATMVALSAPASAATSADVQLDKSASPAGNVAPDNDIVYTLDVVNQGPSDASSVSVSDPLPPGTTFVSANAPAGYTLTTPAVGSNGTVMATKTTLTALTGGSIHITVHVPAGTANGTVISNTATVSASTSDPTPGNNSGSASNTVTATNADLSLQKTAPATAGPDTDLVYTLTLFNNGPNDASGMDMADALPPGMTFVSASAPAGVNLTTPAVGTNGTVHATAATVTSGAGKTIQITAHIPSSATAGTVFTNNASIGSNTNDPVSSNNTASASTTIATKPTVTVTATTPTAFEGGAQGLFTFSRSGGSFAASLPLALGVAGTATSGSDYDALGTITIPAGQSSVTAAVHALSDNVADDGETVIVTVQSNANYTVGSPSQATVTIRESGGSPAFCQPAPISSYSDRASADVHARNVDCISWYGIALGFPDGTYGPTLQVSRAQMATFVARLIGKTGVGLPPNPPDAFPGDDGGVHELAINQLAALGVLDGTTGEEGAFYEVAQPIRRDDMAKFLYNAYKVITGAPLPAGPIAFSDDTNGGDPHGAGTDDGGAIDALAKAGVVQGFTDGTYRPTLSVSRAAFASFFVRLMQLLVNNGSLPASPP